jgi:hypothetical protein
MACPCRPGFFTATGRVSHLHHHLDAALIERPAAAEMPQGDLPSIKSPKAIRPYEFEVTFPALGGTPIPLGAGGILGRSFLIAERRPRARMVSTTVRAFSMRQA